MHQQQRTGNLPVLKPKVPGGSTRTTTVNKLPIPALSSRHALNNFVHRHNNKTTTSTTTTTTTTTTTKTTRAATATTTKKRTKKTTPPACSSTSCTTVTTAASSSGNTITSSVHAVTVSDACPQLDQPLGTEQNIENDTTSATVVPDVVVAASQAADTASLHKAPSTEPTVSEQPSCTTTVVSSSSSTSVSVSYSIDSVLCSVRESASGTTTAAAAATVITSTAASDEHTSARAECNAVPSTVPSTSDSGQAASTTGTTAQSTTVTTPSTTVTDTSITTATTTNSNNNNSSTSTQLHAHDTITTGTVASSTGGGGATTTSDDALSTDLFASLHVSAGGGGGTVTSSGTAGGASGHAECMSPTAAFLLAFPLVSTLGGGGRVTEVLVEDTPDSRQGTPTTLLQIGGNMMLDKQHHQVPVPPNSALVDNFGPFSFPAVTDKDLHYDIRYIYTVQLDYMYVCILLFVEHRYSVHMSSNISALTVKYWATSHACMNSMVRVTAARDIQCQ